MQPKNYPKLELMKIADEAIADLKNELGEHANIEVFFRATCPYCQERCQFTEPNVCYDNMECASCGKTFQFIEGGFALSVSRKE